MDLGFADATAVVTGGSKGMGRAVAEVLAADGARVAVMARGRAALDETVASLHSLGSPDAVGISVDMTDPGSIAEGFREVGERWGSLNVLVHTIGPAAGRFEDLDDAGWDDAFALGTMSAVRSVREALPLFRAAEWARVAIFSAHSIQRQSPILVAYTAVEGRRHEPRQEPGQVAGSRRHSRQCGLPRLHRHRQLHREPQEIFAAEGLDPADPHDVMKWIDRTFHQPADLGRAGLPDEVASLTAYLVSRRNGYVTGACVNADGGSDFV